MDKNINRELQQERKKLAEMIEVALKNGIEICNNPAILEQHTKVNRMIMHEVMQQENNSDLHFLDYRNSLREIEKEE